MERRYRAALNWYPEHWRAQNGDAMLGTLLDEAEATGATRPSLAQASNLMIFGLRERSRTVLSSEVRDRLSALAWGLGMALAAVVFVVNEWVPGVAVDFSAYVGTEAGFGPFASAGSILFGLWVLAFAMSVLGLPEIGRWTLAATLPMSVALVAFDGQAWAVLRPPLFALATLALIALLALSGKPAATPRGRAWMLITTIGSVAILVPTLAPTVHWARVGGWWMPRSVWGDAINPTLFAAMLLAVALVAAVARHRVWAVAALLMAAPWLLILVGWLVAAGSGILVIGSVAAWLVLRFALQRSGYRLLLTRADHS